MFTSRVPLVEFYENLLPAAWMVGYKIVLTALAREADAPGFYEDVKRYWSSLHDATGPDILFVFAGANAAKELNEHGIRHRREPVAFMSDHVAFVGHHEKKWRMYWQEHFHSPSPWMSDAVSSLRRGKPHLNSDDENIVRNHTLEMYDLRRFLRLREAQLPCLVFTLLSPSEHSTLPLITVPFSRFERSTVYTFLKALAENLEDAFGEINRIKDTIAKLEREASQSANPLRKISDLRGLLRHASRELRSPEVRDAVAQILSLTGTSGRSDAERSRCFQHFQTIRREHQEQYGIISQLQRLIDWSFLATSLPHSFDDNDRRRGETDIRREITQLRLDESEAWSTLETALRRFSVPAKHDESCERWDFFIAYSSADRSVAERAFTELSQIGRAFLDTRCLRPGDRWTERIRAAQNNAKSTLLIIAKETPKSWFAESEYLHAIQLMRHGEHIVVPVLYGKEAKLPYGLEQLQAVRLQEWQDIAKLPELVRHVVSDTGPPRENESGV